MSYTRSALLLGYGYVAKATAPLLAKAGFSLAGTTRSGEKAEQMQADGIAPLVNPDAEALRAAMMAATHILVSVPPGPEGDPVLAMAGQPDLPRLEWLGYLSTTGVYGDAGGGRVDETTPPAPADERSRRRLAAERGWQALSDRTRIFRLSGIYGPGRSALDRLKDGKARRIIKPGQVFSRIHVDDIAATLMASIARPDVPGPFNLADAAPRPQADVVAYAAGLLGIEPPPEEDFATAEMSPMMRSFYASSRRVSGEATRKALGVELEYPSYREGLSAIYAAST
ncbi:SDR family oxidoreductase [Hyphobacterium sp. HN65]|uniref:SDR family oxidoreductase n=1 Tax=Hyphobacterium lacteum TaxID=3116575 RepID=A0ABU7LUV4_9PROT|nr:SDR family oxidoreductase [Hyphobacterium sp. HN65]MEE2527319.1 SDR family oxidoreductase [Hyphobacterium sp. HN65]